MKKKKKGKVRWLSLLLTGCLLLSVIPATAFAAEDTVAAESKDTTAEETQLSGQEDETEKSTTEDVTPAPEQETNAENSKISNTSETDKNVTEEKSNTSEQQDATEESTGKENNVKQPEKAEESKTSENITEKVSENDNKDEKSDTANEKSSEQVSTYADKPDFLPEGVKHSNDYKHTYHTQVDVTANVSVKDSDGTVVETTQVSKNSGEFNFVTEELPNPEVLQTAVENLQTEIEASYKAKGTVAREDGNEKMVVDHFEKASLYTFTPASGDPVNFSTDLDAAKQYFNDHPDAAGTFTGLLDVHQYQIYDYTYNLIVQENSQSTNTITSAAVQNVNFNYQPGDAPQATAEVPNYDADKYEIAYECWQEFESNEPVAAWYSDNGAHGSLPTITKFESGKKYVYFLMLKPKDGYSFSSETTVTVNGENVTSSLSGNYLYVPAIKTITMPTIKVIDVVEINGVTVSFKDGDKPVFTGNVPDGANYAYRCEWWELNSTTGAMSTEFGNFYENKITAFEAGRTYHYGVYVTTYGDVGNIRYVFGSDTKLKINGEFVNYTRYEGDTSDGSDGTMWVLTDLTMTPETGGTIPAEKYTVTYTDGVDNEEIFKDQTYTVESGKATPAFNGTPARDGYKFTGWTPAVTDTVTGNVTYIARWEKLIPAEKYTVTYTDGVDGEEIFKNQTYTVESGKATPAFNGTPARNGYKFTGWTPAVTDTVTGNVTYIAQWEKEQVTPTEKYTVTYTDGVDNEEIFKDQTYTVEDGKTTPAFSGTPARNGYKFTGWTPAVTDTVTGNVTYIAQWEQERVTPAEKYTVTYTDGVDGEEVFKDQSYTVESGKATPAFNGTPTRKGYTFAGWKPAVAATVTDNAIYEATWKFNAETITTPSENKTNTNKTASPKTGDTSNILQWIALLFVSGGALTGAVVIGKKKKKMK